MSKVKENSVNFENKQTLAACYAVIYATDLIKGQWILAICCALEKGKLRFRDLKRTLPGITERMLTLQLRKMEACGLVRRTVYAEVPPRVEYEMTEIARELDPIVNELQSWGERHKALMKSIEEENHIKIGR
jgi:DNA-binding HxlR family transcriptional regulator